MQRAARAPPRRGVCKRPEAKEGRRGLPSSQRRGASRRRGAAASRRCACGVSRKEDSVTGRSTRTSPSSFAARRRSGGGCVAGGVGGMQKGRGCWHRRAHAPAWEANASPLPHDPHGTHRQAPVAIGVAVEAAGAKRAGAFTKVKVPVGACGRGDGSHRQPSATQAATKAPVRQRTHPLPKRGRGHPPLPAHTHAHMQSMAAILALYAVRMASLSAGVAGHEALGVMKCVVVRQMGQVRRACGE